LKGRNKKGKQLERKREEKNIVEEEKREKGRN
jgi:hypothetical protein